MSQSDTPPAIEVKHLAYAYRGHTALAGLSLTVTPKSIHGFVGPNGAGKTTTLKILATLMKPQVGVAKVLGYDVRTRFKDVRKRIGFMPDAFSMYRQMTVFEYLDFFGAAYGIGQSQRDTVIHDILALTDMEARKNDLLKGLSRGMQQRISLARVLVNDPEVLLLDEPASGLDPRARIELMEILRELRNMGKTIFISSHILSELGDLCDSITIIDQGKTRYSGPIGGLGGAEENQRCFTVALEEATPAVEDAVRNAAGIVSVVADASRPVYKVTVDTETSSANDLLRVIIDNGGRVTAFRRDASELNQAFMDLTQPGIRP
jgi:ABC-2 type transport system ATP-binding protein